MYNLLETFIKVKCIAIPINRQTCSTTGAGNLNGEGRVRRRDDAAIIVGQVGVTYVERKLWVKAESSDWLEVWWQQQQPRRQQQQQQQERYKKRVALHGGKGKEKEEGGRNGIRGWHDIA
jgi:hypothetical protein